MTIATTLSDLRCTLGEGILWDDALGVLWWTDIQESLLWQHDPATGRERQWPLPQRLGSFVLTGEPGALILGLAKNIARFDIRTGKFTLLADVEPGNPATRINDGRADRTGNYVFGTMHEGGPEPLGSFYRFTPLGALQRLDLPNIAIANSIAFSPDGETMYWCDTPSRRIHACDYDGQTGEVGNIRVFADLRDADAGTLHKGSPDGSTVDADGCLWNAEWGGNRLTRYAPDGRVLAHVPVPASQPTCPAFRGAARDVLYVASAHEGLSAHRRAEDVNAGAVFRLTVPGVHGLPEARFGHAHVPA
ncbi:SMP-30/gluconolactonase/LRE family protein [Ralstonia sp. UBA689]|uniref:SMP-30/gluconolactonase/LRE family protein n=1 Tax=Ralstonia sp. UBA689 TaxID=1947373 RepID=UPI0025CF0003|nr:SMP-30/gluconolactonase/LRE family protein [Ralstonia sp. UBA689]